MKNTLNIQTQNTNQNSLLISTAPTHPVETHQFYPSLLQTFIAQEQNPLFNPMFLPLKTQKELEFYDENLPDLTWKTKQTLFLAPIKFFAGTPLGFREACFQIFYSRFSLMKSSQIVIIMIRKPLNVLLTCFIERVVLNQSDQYPIYENQTQNLSIDELLSLKFQGFAFGG